MKKTHFEWDEEKDKDNQAKHNVSFALAQRAFLDPHRIIVEDVNRSSDENRFYCIGRVGSCIMPVRFTYRGNIIRIYGAGYWRKGRKINECAEKSVLVLAGDLSATSRKKFIQKVKAMNVWLKSVRNLIPLKEWLNIVTLSIPKGERNREYKIYLKEVFENVYSTEQN